MLSTATSANVGFSQVVQLFAPLTNPAITPGAKNSFYKFEKRNPAKKRKEKSKTIK